MATRYIRNTAILAKRETTYAVDAAPVGSTDAMLVSNVSITPLDAKNVDRELIRNYFGASEQLVGTANIAVSFDVEISAGAALGVAPAWAPLVRACGMAEAVTASARVDYTPVSTAFDSATIYWYDDGVLHKLLGARGTFEMKMGLGDRPVFSFKFIGLNGGISAVAVPATTLTGFIRPLVITDTNTGDITLGCTYSAGALVGGTVYPSKGLHLDIGNSIDHVPLLGLEAIELTNREVTGDVQLDLTAAQEVTFMGTVTGNSNQGLGFVHGTASPGTVLIHLPAAQLLMPTKEEISGKRLQGYKIRGLPSSTAGNDELRICVK